MAAKRFLFIFGRPPEDRFRATEWLDMILTAAAFDQPVALLFLDEGLQPLRRESPAATATPNFQLLQMYDIESVWVERESLEERGLTEQDLAIPVAVLGRAEIAALIADREVVVNL